MKNIKIEKVIILITIHIKKRKTFNLKKFLSIINLIHLSKIFQITFDNGYLCLTKSNLSPKNKGLTFIILI
ncbi:hypothetical protein IW20_02460 [Flavobacterium hydatis]|uniref:Ribosomal protein S8 n=1 Tax=Flavobacterium hydatis TaxID=991 RepID=A0A086ARQ2_FLAHY|nr:hypothetical protein IW20_02460 [Flavobacterium hydatis]